MTTIEVIIFIAIIVSWLYDKTNYKNIIRKKDNVIQTTANLQAEQFMKNYVMERELKKEITRLNSKINEMGQPRNLEE